MKFFAKYLCVFFMMLLFTMSLYSQIVINEVMSSNSVSIVDEDGDYEDWIELYNYSSNAINLAGYGLSDNYEDSYKWVFPDIIINSESFMLIWTSGKNRINPTAPLHTNFSISAGGEEVVLTDPQGIIISEFEPIALPTDYSYGRFPDASEEWFYFSSPTPGNSNSTQGWNEILEPPMFSRRGGFYSNEFDLSISHTDSEVTIIYTLDGSIPETQNLNECYYNYKNSYPQDPGQDFGELLQSSYKTNIYSESIAIYDKSSEPDKLTQMSSTIDNNPVYFPDSPVHKGMVVRARAIKAGCLDSPVTSATFFIGENDCDIPVISLIIQEDALFDYENGIYTAGMIFDNWRENNPTANSSQLSPANYHSRGDLWEYPANIEVFNQNMNNFNQSIGVRINGNASRAYRSKSLRIYARSEYGNSELNYSFFPDYQYNSFKRLLLRNAGQDINRAMFKDAFIHQCFKNMNFCIQEYQPSIVYINGEYWGLHNIRERFDKYYFERVFGIDEDNLDFLSNNGVVDEGEGTHYDAMIDYMNQNDISQSEHYEYIKTQMDIENFTDSQIARIFIADVDWPHNNVEFWRNRVSEYSPDLPYGQDGRWRWLLKDTDYSFGLPVDYEHNTLIWATNEDGNYEGNEWATFLLRTLLENEEYKKFFINRFSDLLNSTFKSERIVDMINTVKTKIEPYMPEHINRWNYLSNISQWEYNINTMIEFAEERPACQSQHIQEFFSLSNQVNVEIDVDNLNYGKVRINTLTLNENTDGVSDSIYPWTGVYYGGNPVEIEAVPAPGYVFSHWEGSVNNQSSLLQLDLTEDISLIANFVEGQSNQPELIHYWHFNTLSGTIESVSSDYSSIMDAVISYPGTGEGYMDERTHNDSNPVSNLNLHLGQEPNQGAVLRVRNPSITRELLITSPTLGYKDINITYATTRTSNGATLQALYYSYDGGENWVSLSSEYVVQELNTWELKSFDLISDEVNNNSNLVFKVLFSGENAGADSGNNRFDNISISGVPIVADDFTLEGAGTITDPYQVSSFEDLLMVQETPIYWDRHYIQTNDIDAELTSNSEEFGELGWQPIGNLDLAFTGTYNGNFYKISGLYANYPDLEGVGLFGVVSNEGAILKNIRLDNVNISGLKSVGGLIGINMDCAYIENCSVTGEVNTIGDNNVGGIAGKNENYAIIRNCYTNVVVTGTDSNVGGLVGLNDDFAEIIDCYSLGSVTGNERVGGFAGRNRNDALINNSYSVGLVTGTSDEYINGFCGRNQAVVNNCFWNTETSGYTENSEQGAEGKTTTELKMIDTYANSEWDFENTWVIETTVNSGYPALVYQLIPIHLSALIQDNHICLSWQAPYRNFNRLLLGYNIYRDNVQINDSIIPDCEYTDNIVIENETYLYYVKAIYASGESFPSDYVEITYTTDIDEDSEIIFPLRTSMLSVYPNPFNITQQARFDIEVKKGEIATLKIFNIKGQLVKVFDILEPGKHNPVWNGKDNYNKTVASGIYLYQLSSPSANIIKKMIMIK
jgi:hypothetical protein